jgi:hypothetical protein
MKLWGLGQTPMALLLRWIAMESLRQDRSPQNMFFFPRIALGIRNSTVVVNGVLEKGRLNGRCIWILADLMIGNTPARSRYWVREKAIHSPNAIALPGLIVSGVSKADN